MRITPETSYIIGLIQTDGHMNKSSRNRGKLTIELSDIDRDIIYKIAKYIPYNYSIFKRTRKTNFSNNFHGIGIRVYNQEFRAWLNQCGIPYGKKSLIVSPPLHLKDLSIDDYVRGLWDGDGSVGYTGSKIPYLSFTTHSPALRDFIENYISQTLGCCKNHFTKPKRDNVFNIMITKESAILLANKIYPLKSKHISIKRKFINAQKVKTWKRPDTMRRITWGKEKWSKEEEVYLLNNGAEATIQKFQRTRRSVIIKLCRLKKIKSLSLPTN